MSTYWKILYLPLAMYVTINGSRKAIIKTPIDDGPPWLCAPEAMDNEEEEYDEDYSTYVEARFSSKYNAINWVTELINRDACKHYNLRLEHFEIVRIDKTSK